MKIIIILLLISSPLYAEWTAQDTAFQTIFLGTLFVDAWQTYTFLYTSDYRERGFYEINPVLGKYPSKQRFFTYWSSCAIIHTSISHILPKPYRTLWQFIWIGVESSYIYHNYKLSVKLNY